MVLAADRVRLEIVPRLSPTTGPHLSDDAVARRFVAAGGLPGGSNRRHEGSRGQRNTAPDEACGRYFKIAAGRGTGPSATGFRGLPRQYATPLDIVHCGCRRPLFIFALFLKKFFH
jgi:hypothetical protein